MKEKLKTEAGQDILNFLAGDKEEVIVEAISITKSLLRFRDLKDYHLDLGYTAEGALKSIRIWLYTPYNFGEVIWGTSKERRSRDEKVWRLVERIRKRLGAAGILGNEYLNTSLHRDGVEVNFMIKLYH